MEIINIYFFKIINICLFNLFFVTGQYENTKRFQWSDWGIWSLCSRTCDLGVQTRTRTCFDKFNNNYQVSEYYCGGNKYDYKTCYLKSCSKDSLDFRTQQCEEESQRKNWGNFYKWRPFLDGGSTCNLLCMPKGYTFYREFAEKVIDGTRCGYDLNGICVNGECMNIGCDGLINSTKKYDKCGKCGGDNLSCNLISGLYTDNHAEKGYHTVAIFPKGSKNINITEFEASDNFLALKTEKGVNILNSVNSRIEYSGLFNAVGSDIQYFRRRFIANKDFGESIFINGPIQESIILEVLYYSYNPGIVYYYSLDFAKPDTFLNTINDRSKLQNYLSKENNNNNFKFTHLPSVTDTSKSNYYENVFKYNIKTESKTTYNEEIYKKTTTNTTTTSQVKILVNKLTSNKADYNNQSTSNKYNESQRKFHIHNDRNKTGRYMWFVAGLTPCSVTCGIGFKQEIIRCLDRLHGKIVHQSYCRFEIRPSGKNHTCNITLCLPSWDISEWSTCSSSCGIGTQYRSLKCVQQMSATSSIELKKDSCKDIPIPELKRSCNVNCTYWKIDKWQNCQVTCGRGAKIRNVACVNQFETPVDESLCVNPKPQTVGYCDMGSCAKVWFYSNWSNDCEVKCEKDIFSTRRVICGANILSNSNNVEEYDNCDHKSKPESKKICKNDLSKCQSKWFTGPWNECSASCNEGIRKRAVVCLIEVKSKWLPTGDTFCNPKEKPINIEKCFKESCKAEWFISDWSECSRTCDIGVRSREVKCIDENNKPSMECDETIKPQTKEGCNQKECPQGEEKIKQIDPNCIDYDTRCDLIKRSNLCNYYRNRCCKTCK